MKSNPGLPQGRFTPTCVGNTEQEREIERLRGVHPHVCGEYVTTWL